VGLLQEALPASTLVVAIDPGKVSNRVWLSTGEAGEVAPDPRSISVDAPSTRARHRTAVRSAAAWPPLAAVFDEDQTRWVVRALLDGTDGHGPHVARWPWGARDALHQRDTR
jgi:hypothetical protein